MTLADGTRLRILRGDATAEQVAALLVALDHAATAPKTARPALERAWQRAARLEGLGGAPVQAADDPRLHRARRP